MGCCFQKLLYEDFPVQTKMYILSRRWILLAILLYEQFIQLTQIPLRPNIQFLSTHFWLLPWFDLVCNTVTRWVNFKEKHLHEHEIQLLDYNK